MNVLVVEDDPTTGQLLLAVLSRAGLQGTLVASAESASERIAADGVAAWPFCIIDLALPGRDGLWLCQWIRRQSGGESPYLIVGTGSDHSEKLAAAFDAGADDYVEKPYEPAILDLRFAVARQRIDGRRERDRLSDALDDEERLVTTVFDTAAACIVALDPSGNITKTNGASGRLIAQSPRSLEGKSFARVFTDSPDQSRTVGEKISRLIEGREQECQFETELTSADGESRTLAWLARTSDPGHPDAGRMIVCVGTDITDRRRLETQLAFLAERDPLTHLFNRSQLDPALQRALDQTLQGIPGALICLDLDDFKIVNDTAGHAAGDALLQSVAHAIARHTRRGDTVIRLGGDEFIVVLPETTLEKAETVAERIRCAVQHLEFPANERIFRVTASIGLAALHARMTLEETLAQADTACYASKRNGRNLVTVSKGHELRENAGEQAWHARLVDAIAHDAFDLWIQPIVSFHSGEVEFQEVLLRLPGADGASEPGHFLPSARRFNLLPELDRCVVKNAIALLEADPNLRLSINLSGRTVSDPRLPDFLVSCLGGARVDPDRVIFEITESELISDLPLAIERLTELRSRGFRFALDDFGRGYSSFSYLRKLPIEIVKIDGSFTQALADDPASAAFIKAITELSHALGMTCVAEHVEDEASAVALRELNVDLGQGFHLGMPHSSQGPRPPASVRPHRKSQAGLILPG